MSGQITEAELKTMWNKIRTAGVRWMVSVNKGKVLKAKATTEFANEIFKKKFDTVVGCYDERIKLDQLQEDLEYFGVQVIN